MAGAGVAGGARFFALPLRDECNRRMSFVFAPHVEGGADVFGVFGGEVFFGGEEHLGAVGGHADVFDGGGFFGERSSAIS